VIHYPEAMRSLHPTLMAVTNRLLVLGACLLAVGTACASLPMDENAKKLLLRSMEHAYNVNVRAIVVQKCTEDGSMQELKIEQSCNGKARFTVLGPLRYQGIESIDDGSQATTYLPDSHVMLVQASSRKESCRAKQRLALAEKNYRLTVETSGEVAGRKTVCVQATPRHAGLPSRRYYLDAKTAYLLRSEVIGPKGSQVQLDTKAVSYPDEISEDLDIHSAGASTVRYSRQWEEPARDGDRQLGFEPLIPAFLPLGFAIQEVKVSKSQDWNSIVVRISDGLVRGTVYQWKPSDRDSDSSQTALDRSALVTHGLRLLLVADIPPAARERILRAFSGSKDRACGSERSYLEPTGDRGMLACFSGRSIEPRAFFSAN